MASWEHELVDPPAEPRARELWLQHAAGFILLEDVRRFAMERIDPAVSGEPRAAVRKGIDDALYGLMMVIDGVTGGISNARRAFYIDFIVRLATRADSEASEVLSEVDLGQGDGMCMGYHGWLEGDFGRIPIAVPRSGTREERGAGRNGTRLRHNLNHTKQLSSKLLDTTQNDCTYNISTIFQLAWKTRSSGSARSEAI
jgi:hypothetical protein